MKQCNFNYEVIYCRLDYKKIVNGEWNKIREEADVTYFKTQSGEQPEGQRKPINALSQVYQ
jgi:hypothetical protein